MELSDDRAHVLAPVWFEEPPLKAQSFNAETYITELSRYVPLNTICTQLDSYLAQLKQELVEVINAKYNDFVGLAGQLSGVEGAIVRITKPFADLKGRLNAVERWIESELSLLSANLEYRKKLKKAKRALETMQSAVQIVAKIEKLMQEVDAVMTHGDVSQQSALLERLSREIGLLDVLLKENEELQMIEILVQQTQKSRSEVYTHLESCLRKVFHLEKPDHGAAMRLLNALAAVGRAHVGEALIRDLLLKPVLEDISKEESDEPVQPQRIVQKLGEEISGIYGGFFPVVCGTSAGLQHYDFVGNCILTAFHTHINKTLPSVFSPGQPDAFLHNFKSSLELIDLLEARCATIEALESFRNSDALNRFMKAWNLQVYFAMRFQEIAGMLESTLNSDHVPMKATSDAYMFRVVSIWIQCLQQCFNPQIVTEHLLEQFVKLFFRLLSRFEHWLKQNIDALHIRTEENKASPPRKFPQKNEDLALFHRDLLHSRSVFLTEFYLSGLEEASQDAVKDAVASYLERLEQLQRSLLDAISQKLLEECSALVKKSVGTAVSTMFRPGGERPTAANDYVKRLVEPLHFFLNASAVASQIQNDVKAQITSNVVKGLSTAYHQALMDNLSFRERSQMSLKRLNKGKFAVASGSDGSSETGKGDELKNVYHQYWLDVCAFGTVLEKLGIAQMEEYSALRDFIISKREAHDSASS